jgi:2-dehydro-3-deoxyphosphogluconate aldolase / (4S)-4-hydroxy-2-oxoglutarate aldolase
MTVPSRLSADVLLEQLVQHKLVAIVRGRDADASVATCLALVDAGISMLEVSLTTDRALYVLEQVANRIPDHVMLGAGTVLQHAQVKDVTHAGARYLVTPALAPSLEAAAAANLPVLAGALTPTEVVEARRRGAAAVKIFPASVLGPAYLRALRDPLPDVPLIAVGGIDASSVMAYVEAGAVGVGVGSPLCGDAPHGGELGALRRRAATFLSLLSTKTGVPR